MSVRFALRAWSGNVEDCDKARAFGREYPWEEEIESPEFAADQVLAALEEDQEIQRLGGLHPEAAGKLRAALEDSAVRTRS